MVSWLPHVTSFLCCLGLEAGAKLIGYLHLIASLLVVSGCSFLSWRLGTQMEGDEVYTAWHRITLAIAVASVVHVALALTLLYGVAKRRTVCFRVWVVSMLALQVGALIFVIATSAARGLSGSGSDIFLSFLEGLLFFSVVSYCIICVNSYYMMVKSCEDMEGPKHTPY